MRYGLLRSQYYKSRLILKRTKLFEGALCHLNCNFRDDLNLGKTPIRNLEQIYCFLDELSFIGLAPCYDVIDEKFTAWAVQKKRKKIMKNAEKNH